GGQSEIKDIEVLGNTVGFNRFGDCRAALIKVPAQHDMGWCLSMSLGNLTDRRVFQRTCPIIAPAGIVCDSTNRIPRLVNDSMLTVSLLNATLAEVGVDLDLVDRRYHIGFSQQPLQVLGHKVADPNCSDLPLGQ